MILFATAHNEDTKELLGSKCEKELVNLYKAKDIKCHCLHKFINTQVLNFIHRF